METVEKRTNWKPTDKRFVAYLDLLGFKDKVMRSSHEDIYAELNTISTVRRSLEKSVDKDSIQKTFNDVDIYIVSFSDSIVLFSKNDSEDNFKFFSIALLGLFSNAIKSKIAIKGSVAHGMISINKSEQIYFGQPIIDAYLLEEDVNFLGIVCHNSIDKYLRTIPASNFVLGTYKFTETPLKYGNINHTFVDYYNYLLDSTKKKEMMDNKEITVEIINIIEDFYETVSGSPRRYIDNTVKFLNKIEVEGKIEFKSPNL